jgi:heme-degrading monooxygenase HmoA
MIASVSIADIGVPATARFVIGGRAKAPGLLDLHTGQTARFRDSVRPDVAFGRVATIGFWDDDESLDRFLTGDTGSRRADRVAEPLRGGLTVRLRPLRVHGAWPGLPEDTPTERDVDSDGPVVVLTIGYLRALRSVPWLRASARAQGALGGADGLVWAMGMSQPPRFVATMSFWESAEASKAYAFAPTGGHHAAVEANRATPFMHQEAFIRFHPYASSGSLGGNPSLAADWLSSRQVS